MVLQVLELNTVLHVEFHESGVEGRITSLDLCPIPIAQKAIRQSPTVRLRHSEIKCCPPVYHFCIKNAKREARVKKGGVIENVSKYKQRCLVDCNR